MTDHSNDLPPAAISAWAVGSSRSGRRTSMVLLAVVAFGLGLRTAQYLGRVDMWHDELAIARNVADRSFGELVSQPLDHLQMAPVGFLAAVDISSNLIGMTESGFRFAPWIFGLISVLLFWRIAQRFTDGYSLLAVLALFAFSPAMIWYGSSVKPYGGDIAISMLLVLFGQRYLEKPEDLSRSVAAGLIGGIALLFSFPTVPTAAVLALVLTLAWWRIKPRPELHPLAVLAVCWGIGAALAAWAALTLTDPATDSFMRQFWAEDFPPLGLIGGPLWFASKLYQTFAHSLIFLPPVNIVLVVIVSLPLALAVLGMLVGGRQRPMPTLLLLVPILAAFAAAFVRLMPFDNRVGLHAVWPVLVLAGAGLTGLNHRLQRRAAFIPRAVAAVTAIPLVLIVILASRPPLRSPGPAPREILQQLAEQLRPDDSIYVYTQGRHDMAYYGAQAGISSWVQGDPHFDDVRGYLREVDALRGQPRAWFFWVQLDGSDPQLIREYLGTIGHEVHAIPTEVADPVDPLLSAGAVLFDLSDPGRLNAANAESFPVDR